MIDNDLLYRAAVDYYINNKIQREIAQELGVSRVQVSKYLKMAKERGLVHVEVIPSHIGSEEKRDYNRKFKEKFRVEEVLICPSYSHEDTLTKRLSGLAEEYIFRKLNESACNIGLGWGHAVYEFTRNMGRHDRSSWRVVPLVGGTTFASSKYFNTNHIVHLLAEKLGAQAVLLYLPFLMEPSKYRKDKFFSEEYNRIYSIWEKLDLVVCGVGHSILQSPFFRNEAIQKYTKKLEKNMVVGDLLTQHFNIQGHHVPFGIEELMINVTYEQVRRAKKKLIIAYGNQKIEALVGAMNNGELIDVLVTDQNTADSILEFSAELPEE